MTEANIVLAVVVAIVLVTAAITTNFGKDVKTFLFKVFIKPGRGYWAARIDAFGDASMFAAIGSIVLNILGLTVENTGIELSVYLFLGAIMMFMTSNWFKN